MPSLDMLKKLLDEFADREAHTREEINVVNQQIEDLEKRIEAALVRQVRIAGDRENILTMRERYSGNKVFRKGKRQATPKPSSGDSRSQPKQPTVAADELTQAAQELFSSPPPMAIPLTNSASPFLSSSGGSFEQASTTEVESDSVNQAPSSSASEGSHAALDLFKELELNQGSRQPAETEEKNISLQSENDAEIQPEPTDKETAESKQEPESAEDDTVKSINDALRGLFK